MYIVIPILIGLIPAVIAKNKGKNFGLWWLYGAGLFIIALPHALLMSPNKEVLEEKQIKEGNKKRCPYCYEVIDKRAKVCPYCKKDLTNGETNEN